MIDYPLLNSKVTTPDGPGIVKSIELRGEDHKTVVICLLEKSFKQGWHGRDYDFPPFSIGYPYDLRDIGPEYSFQAENVLLPSLDGVL